MPFRDITQLLAPVYASGLVPAVIAADSANTAIDLDQYSAAALYIMVGVGGITFDNSNKIEFKLTHSTDDGSSDPYVAVTASDVRCADSGFAVGAGGIVLSLTAAHAAATITEIGYIGGRRYLKLLADFSGTHGTGTAITALVLKGRPVNRLPVA
jgi:hypothetical protein